MNVLWERIHNDRRQSRTSSWNSLPFDTQIKEAKLEMQVEMIHPTEAQVYQRKRVFQERRNA